MEQNHENFWYDTKTLEPGKQQAAADGASVCACASGGIGCILWHVAGSVESVGTEWLLAVVNVYVTMAVMWSGAVWAEDARRVVV